MSYRTWACSDCKLLCAVDSAKNPGPELAGSSGPEKSEDDYRFPTPAAFALPLRTILRDFRSTETVSFTVAFGTAI